MPVTVPTEILDYQQLGVPALLEAFESLTKKQFLLDKLNLENQKLKILEAVLEKLKQDLSLRSVLHSKNDKELESMLRGMVKNALYYFFLLFGLFEDASGSFLYSKELFALIPGLSNAAVLFAAISFTVLNCILFYAVEVVMLKEALGIAYSNTDLGQLIETHSQKIKSATELNQLLSSLQVMTLDNEHYEEYLAFAKAANHDLFEKQAEFGDYQESILKNTLKFGVIVFGVLSSTASSYFFAMQSLEYLAPAILGTPMGSAVILLTILGNLGLYYAMGGMGMVRLVNPDFEAYQTLRDDLVLFQERYQDDLQPIFEVKKQFGKKKTFEVATQTDVYESAAAHPGLTFFSPEASMSSASLTSSVDQSMSF